MSKKCSKCDDYKKQGHNYCRMCGVHIRKGYARKNGHRQWYTNIEVQNIQVTRAKAKPKTKAKAEKPKEEKK